jgi:hypothetical protein
MSINISLGTSTADSYVSVGSANTYFNQREDADAWISISSGTNSTAALARKENILKQATREIDRTFRFHSSKYNQGIRGQSTYQNLEFPRSVNVDSSSNLILPFEIKFATYEQALWILERSGKRTSEDGAVNELQIIGDECKNYINPWINRQIEGDQPWKWKQEKVF